MTDAYITEVMDLDRSKSEMEKPGQRRAEMEQAAKDRNGQEHREQDTGEALEHLDRF